MKKEMPKVYAFIDSQNLNLGTSKNIIRHGKVKGNVDAELVLHAAKIQYDKYDKAVIISGDGDFYCLHEFLVKNKKLLGIIIPNDKSESSLLKPFQKYKTFIVFEKSKLELKS